jgi:hypothetical protein
MLKVELKYQKRCKYIEGIMTFVNKELLDVSILKGS